VRCIDQLNPDVVLMDLRMPRTDGIEATKTIKRRRPQTQVLVLTTFDDHDSVLAALDAGASGYVLKDTPSEQLARDILTVHAGHASLSPSVAQTVISELRQRDVVGHASSSAPRVDQEGRERLSERELEVLRLVGKGLSNREIGRRLSITEGTVKNHVSSILSKLQLRDRTQAVLFAKEHGLI
jgi:DNA-binding NarL/FixJ family response regulator